MKFHTNAFLHLFIIGSGILYGRAIGHEVTFYVHNKCAFAIWPTIAPNASHPVVTLGGFYLPSGKIDTSNIPWNWNGRIWTRIDYDFTSNCEPGDCDRRLECNELIGKPSVTLIQLAVQADKSKTNLYDVRLVDGYNIPVTINSRRISSKCTISSCQKDLKNTYPDKIQVLSKERRVVACKSACLVFDIDRFCRRNGTPETCRPNIYSMLFKEACPNYSSYAYDTPSPLVPCSAKEYVITFCPANWGRSSALKKKKDKQHSCFKN